MLRPHLRPRAPRRWLQPPQRRPEKRCPILDFSGFSDCAPRGLAGSGFSTLSYLTTLRYPTAPHCTLLFHRTAPYCALGLRYLTVPSMHLTALSCTLLCFTAPYCNLLQLTVPYCTLLHLTGPYCTSRKNNTVRCSKVQ